VHLHLKRLKNLLHFNYLIFILCVCCCFCAAYRTNNYKSKYNSQTTSVIGTLLSVSTNGNQLKFLVKGKENVIAFYYADTKEELEKLSKLALGSLIEFGGNLEQPSENTVFNLYNYKNYLKGIRIFWTMRVTDITLIEQPNCFYKIKIIC